MTASPRNSRRNAVEIARRQARVLEMREQGMTLREIAAELGVSHGLVYKDMERALAAIPVKSVEDYREKQRVELDQLRTVVLDVINRRHITVSTQTGRIARDSDGNEVLDDAPLLAAVDRLMKINEREAKLFGMDAKPEVQITGNLHYHVIREDSGQEDQRDGDG